MISIFHLISIYNVYQICVVCFFVTNNGVTTFINMEPLVRNYNVHVITGKRRTFRIGSYDATLHRLAMNLLRANFRSRPYANVDTRTAVIIMHYHHPSSTIHHPSQSTPLQSSNAFYHCHHDRTSSSYYSSLTKG